MGLNRYAKKRDAAEADIVKALRKAGCRVWLLDRPVDLLVHWAGLLSWLEVKNPDWDGKYSSEEQREACEVYGAAVVKDEAEALRAIGVI